MITEDVRVCAKLIKEGEILAYPTDTLYGLGTDVFNEDALFKLFNLKRRDRANPVSIAVSDLASLRAIADVEADIPLRQLLPGPYTILLRAKESFSDLTSKDGVVAVRVPDHPVALRFLALVARPLTCTSANISGSPPMNDPEEIEQRLGNVNVLEGPPRPMGVHSTVLDLTSSKPRVLRKGAGYNDLLKIMENLV